MNNPPVGSPAFKELVGGSVVRYSSAVRKLRENTHVSYAAIVEQAKKEADPRCSEHGILDDPVIGLIDDKIAFACPWCSGSAILEAWEREGVEFLRTVVAKEIAKGTFEMAKALADTVAEKDRVVADRDRLLGWLRHIAVGYDIYGYVSAIAKRAIDGEPCPEP